MARELTIEQRDLAASRARVTAAVQVSEILTSTLYGGSKDYLAQRLRAVLEAERRDDDMVLRGTLIELSVASAAYAASLDPELPSDMRPGRRRNGSG